jgi:signal transduction histidine kinase
MLYMLKRVTIRRQIRGGFLAGLAVVLGVSALALWSIVRWGRDVEGIAHSQDVLVRLESVLSGIEAAEAGERGYLLTGKASYLTDYLQGAQNTKAVIAGLGKAAPHDAGHARIIERLEQQVDAMLTQLADTVELRKTSGLGVVRQKVLSDRNEDPMDNIRAVIGTMQQIEYGLIGKRVNAQRAAALIGEWALIVGGAIALALGILALASVERSVKDRETAHALLEQSEGDLRNSTLLLQVRNAQIEKATRLKSEFLANMSHELRTPLHTIIGFSEVLSEELQGPLNDKQVHCINVIHKDALFLLQLINDILDLSKIESGKLNLRPERFDVATVLDQVLTSVRSLSSAKAIRIESEVPPATTLHADPVRFKQVIYNLLSNAVKFTPEAGKIRVEATPRDGFLEVVVSDNGIGIPKEEQETIFNKFYQTESGTRIGLEGAGLGLAITKRLVVQHGGRIWVESERGKGSSFKFTVPFECSA